MNKAKIFIAAMLIAGASAVYGAGFVKSGQSVTVSLPQADAGCARTVRLTVINERIIKVEATPDSEIPCKRKSLIVVPQKGKTAYTATESDTAVTVETASLTVTVDKRTGKTAYRDRRNGKTILSEADGGKKFKRFISGQTVMPESYHPTSPDEINWGKTGDLTRISLDDRSGYTWHLQFDGNDDEAIYGLGQHQSEDMNYKGKNEELFQYNTKVSIPFVVSTAGYGLLWDSYSYGRWGNPDDYVQLGEAFTLYNKDGKLGCLTGTYAEKGGRRIVRDEDSLYFENSREIVNLPRKFRLNGSRVLYEGWLEAPESADYQFILYYAGYTKVYIDGRPVMPEIWRKAWNPNARKFNATLLKGRKTKIRIEWQPDGDVSYCGLRVATPRSESDRRRVSIWNEMSKDMTYYFIAGDDMDEIISGYRALTGRAQVMPRWALGFWQSRERYKTQREVVDNMSEFRSRGIPCDVIVQDWNYWPDPEWGSHKFEASRYPDPQAMYDTIHAMHGRLMISCWPKFYESTANFKELDANGWMYRRAVEDSIKDWVGPGYVGSFYDAYSAGARKMFWRQMDENLYSKYGKGMDAWWMDASEPNVRDCTPIDYRKQLCGPTAMGTSDEYFNAYSIVNADAIYNGQRSVDPDKRVFLLTRSGFAGLQRYSTATWSGDIGTRWEDMRAQITAGLNFSMAGVPFWGMDQGGFTTEDRYVKAQKLFDKTGRENDDLREWRELNARWHQFGCFVPLFRTHGQWPAREVWNIAPENHECYRTIVEYTKLRYRMMPYLYSMAGWVNRRDYTVMRGLAMDFAGDRNVFDIADQWMFGPAFMACPVTEYKARERQVYFPAGCGWYDLYTGKHIDGGQEQTVDAPYHRMPVFVREGAIIPFGSDIQWSDERQADTIDLYVYAGADGRFELYEDEGTNYNYEKGRFATIDISYEDKSRILTIGSRRGSFKGMLKERVFNIVMVGKDRVRPLNLDNPEGVRVSYDGRRVSVAL